MGVIQSEHGDTWFFTLLAIVFFGDTFAYFIGRATGKTKIWPLISPNKTWEGAIGGLFGSVLGAILMKFLFLYEVPALAMVLLAVFAGAAAQIGDFFESLLKRVANKKDSGSLMPGHGGILDRIDGVLFAAPFVYVASRVFLKIF
jgi:phosphatidate cytidylyltransferase